MALWIETSEALALRRRREDFVTLVRNYHAGRPYRNPYLPYAVGDDGNEVVAPDENTYLWQKFLCPTDIEEVEDIPVYVCNLVNDALQLVILELLPDDMELVLSGAEVEDLDELLAPMLYFGEEYSQDIQGALNWVRDLAEEVAKAGDHLPIVRYMPESQHLTYDGAPSEFWDAEVDPITGKVLFYRVEYVYPILADGMVPTILHSNLYREDIYSDRVERFEAFAMPGPQQMPPLGGQMIQSAIDSYAGNKPIDIRRIDETDDEDGMRAAVEKTIYDDLGHGPAFPILWHAENLGENRGVSEFRINQLRALDAVNRLYMSWADSAHNTGNPPLGGINFEPPGTSGKSHIFAAGSTSISGRKKGLVTQDGFRPGSSWTANSKTEKEFYFGYPQNQPTVPPYDGIIDALKATFWGVNQAGTLDPTKISHVGQMSGYASNEYKKLHNQRIKKYRSRFISKVTQMLNYALQLAVKLKLITLPEPEEGKKIRLEFRFGRSDLTPDEEMKMVVTNNMAADAGYPVEQMGPERWPFRSRNYKQVIAGLKEVQQTKKKALDLSAQPVEPGTPGGVGSGAAADRVGERVARSASKAGVDNKAK